ncbi:hypothetical protein MTsDn5_37820 [Alteromonas gracilis]|uniref:DUF6694 family lipoprotein n=1 Tax=Alteromonas gracilis TaxID=1479524 RepID=UPI0036F3E637
MKSLFFLLSIILITGCASVDENLVLNGKSAASLENDINIIVESLPNRKKHEFMIALLSIQMDVAQSPLAFLGNPDGNAVNYELLSQHLDGLTYKQVLELASKSKTSVEVLTD